MWVALFGFVSVCSVKQILVKNFWGCDVLKVVIPVENVDIIKVRNESVAQ